MTYDRLTQSYWDNQIARIKRVLEHIVSRPQAVVPGRVIPEPDELALGTGRSLFAAVMFTDISGFSARPSSSYEQQAALLQVMNLYFSEMITVAEEYFGTVEKNTGDGLMAYFEDNAGEPKETACKRALSCALTMMYVTENAINLVLEQSQIDPIKFRIAIDYGHVTIAQLGAKRRFGGLVAIGATANIASKMLGSAQPGDILIGENVYGALPSVWKTRWCVLQSATTGWVYVHTQAPYRFYRYTGRWIGPLL